MTGNGLLGLVIGAGLGLVMALAANAALSKVEASAIAGLDRNKAEAKRSMYGTIRKAVLAVDVVFFAALGWFVASQMM
jgi:hypothetical protein